MENKTTINSDCISSTNQTSVVFKIRSCQKVIINLTSNQSTCFPKYKVAIGKKLSNGTFISKLKTCLVDCDNEDDNAVLQEKVTDEILHCNETKTFWISWKSSISFGLGDIVHNKTLLTGPLNEGIIIDYFVMKSSNLYKTDKWMMKSGDE